MIRISWLLVSYLAAAIVILAGPDQPEQAIDTEHSFLTVHVGKAGLLSAAAHEHWINAPIAGGTIAADGSTPAVRFTVDARRLSVRPEKGVSDKDRAEVQSNMQSKVLESNIYPDIVFRSTEVRRTGALVWGVSSRLDPAWGHKAGQRRRHSAKRRLCWHGSHQADGVWHSADQNRRRCRQGEGRAGNQLSGVHGVTLTRLQGRSTSRPRKPARSTLIYDLSFPAALFRFV
jgi:hypothetical protein